MAELAVRRTITGAVDIGGTKIAVGAVDADGRVLAKEETPTAAQKGFDAAMKRVAAMLERVRSKAGEPLGGIGIGCTGPVDPVSGEIGDVEFLPGWKGCNPVRVLSHDCRVSAAMENDADAMSLGESRWGAGRGKKSMIFVTVGTGIGGGIVIDGVLYRGVGGAHPEIGHHIIDQDGPVCFCGAKGCWEIHASGPAMAKRFHELPQSSARALLTAKDICELARKGDEAALREVTREGHYLGVGLANLVTLFTPDVIALGGNVMSSADLFLPAIRDVIRRSCGLVPSEKVELKPSELGADVALIGAAMVWRHRFEGK